MVEIIVTMLLSFAFVNPIKWSKTLKQFVGKFPANFLSMFDHFVGLTNLTPRYSFTILQRHFGSPM